MGASANKRIPELDDFENNVSLFFDAYKSIKQINFLLNSFNNISFNAYLISTKSIPNFIYIIKHTYILNYLNKRKQLLEVEKDLDTQLKFYELENDIKIYYNYYECLKIMKENNEETNEFIIVDELFCRTMNIEDYFYDEKMVNIIVDKTNKIMKIKMQKNNTIYFEKKDEGFYKFVEKNDKNEKINLIDKESEF